MCALPTALECPTRPAISIVATEAAPADPLVGSHSVGGAERVGSVSVVIPTKNEERNIAWVLRRIPAWVDEILIVDGASRDRTLEVVRAVRPDARIVIEPSPGKGVALRTGFAAASGEVVVMLDADCSMDPAEIERFIQALAAGADLVKGSRFLLGGGTVDMTALRRYGNHVLVGIVNRLFNVRFTELCYGYIAFWRRHLATLSLKSAGFEIETEIVVRAVKAELAVVEVPSFEARRQFGNSNLHPIRDGLRILRTLLQERRGSAADEHPWYIPKGAVRTLSTATQLLAVAESPYFGEVETAPSFAGTADPAAHVAAPAQSYQHERDSVLLEA